MLLDNKVAVVYGAGAIGGAIAQTFTDEGAQVFVASRTASRLEKLAREVPLAGTALVDAFDVDAVRKHIDGIVTRMGRIDVAVNAIGVAHVQGIALPDLSFGEFMAPVEGYVRSSFAIAQAVSRHMIEQRFGVILTLSTPGARLALKGILGNGVSSAAVEAFSRLLAAELGPSGVRAVCIRPHAIPEAARFSHTRDTFTKAADTEGMTLEELLTGLAEGRTLLHRLPELSDVANFAAFAASDRAASMTGAIGNLSAGGVVD